jgi:hypothetical protein
MASEMNIDNILWLFALIAFIFFSNYATHYLGKWHYEHNEPNGKIFDILHHITPDLQKYAMYNDTILVITMISFLFVPNSVSILKEFLGKFILIMFVRALTIMSTILPKQDGCSSELTWMNMFKGQCYDKVFSGHTAFVLLATLIYLRENIISFPAFLGINLANITSIILTRSHYTIDVILAVVITYLVYDGDYTVFTKLKFQ